MVLSGQIVELLGDVADLSGTLMIAYAALSVHHRFRNEHKVDEQIFNAMKTEVSWAIVGIGLLITGFAFKVIGRFILI